MISAVEKMWLNAIRRMSSVGAISKGKKFRLTKGQIESALIGLDKMDKSEVSKKTKEFLKKLLEKIKADNRTYIEI